MFKVDHHFIMDQGNHWNYPVMILMIFTDNLTFWMINKDY